MAESKSQNSILKNRKFWIPVLTSIPVAIICFVIVAVTADLGFETYEAGMIFFPYMMLSTYWFTVIPPVIGIATLFQWPLYGVIIAVAWAKKRLVRVLEILLIVHIIAVCSAIYVIKYSERKPILFSAPEARGAKP